MDNKIATTIQICLVVVALVFIGVMWFRIISDNELTLNGKIKFTLLFIAISAFQIPSILIIISHFQIFKQ